MISTGVRVVVLLLAAAMPFGCGRSQPAKPLPDPAKQARRMEFLNKAIEMGLVHRFDHGLQVPRLYVTDAFYDIPIEQKQKMVGILFEYCQDAGGATVMTVHDHKSGREIGSVKSWRPFEMD